MFIDVHCHLEMCKDIESIIKEAKSKKVLIVTQGVNIETNRQSLELSEKYSEVKSAIGLYPDEILKLNDSEIDSELGFIKKNILSGNAIAIGEIGLDGTYPQLEKQLKAFRKMVKLAIDLDVPVIIHSRKAELQCIEELEKLKAKRVLMHCFSGNLKLVERIVNNGWYLSIPSNVTFSEHFQKVVSLIDIHSLFGETDSPYLHPEKKFPNNPINVTYSYKKIAEIKNLKLDLVVKELQQNYKELFKQ